MEARLRLGRLWNPNSGSLAHNKKNSSARYLTPHVIYTCTLEKMKIAQQPWWLACIYIFEIQPPNSIFRLVWVCSSTLKNTITAAKTFFQFIFHKIEEKEKKIRKKCKNILHCYFCCCVLGIYCFCCSNAPTLILLPPKDERIW